MKKFAATTVALVVLVGGLSTGGKVTPDAYPGWLCDWMPFLCVKK